MVVVRPRAGMVPPTEAAPDNSLRCPLINDNHSSRFGGNPARWPQSIMFARASETGATAARLTSRTADQGAGD